MRANGLLKWLMVPVLLLVLFVGIRLFSAPSSSARPTAGTDSQLTRDEMQALGIEGDTPRDTVATLVAQVKQLRGELHNAVADNQSQRSENQRLRQRESAIDERINAALEAERGGLRREQEQLANERQQSSGLLQELQQRLDGLGGSNVELPLGLGLREGDEQGLPADGAIRWFEPNDAPPAEPRQRGRLGMPSSFGPAQRPLDASAEALSNPGPKVERRALDEAQVTQAVYTLPSNSTLMGSVAMTALIGRVPIDGTVNDPYPFKVLVGPDNLTANGIDLPEVAGAVFSGTASGDWTLSCVRGQVRSISFVFHDGTIRTLPEDRQGNQANDPQGGLGWISDPQGVPCVTGERRSNAQQYLGSQALLTAAGAGVASFIQPGQNVAVVSGNGGGSGIGTVGISGNEAMSRILAGGVQQMSDWMNKLYGQAFAAVYVQPGAKVAIHLEKPLAIDYAPSGRKVDHRRGEQHALELE
ncbi:integrating conjugative element protein, PFL_4705 family [Delftia tsuruhatensis]|uniref:TIGR03752 family integrating conjugative element protein n=1 Tax=Delftia tsuruhatensis TaxID=180282 RepID=UPI001E78CA42|nr:TIGR03752 family integrating conjugative element protein [Delftia tsuruhatensis]CAB5671080.1 integrating conjugative element protein, PFL_4705 family [Delftia tsuruhatensis]CAC9683141.1 integrating conjugative element protein, PFL_4705 family [Delftia tsuruhatensis]